METKVCQHYIQGRCRYGDKCRKLHPKDGVFTAPVVDKSAAPVIEGLLPIPIAVENRISRENGRQRNPEKRQQRRRIKKNTESFEPNNVPADMRVLFEVRQSNGKTGLNMQTRDVIVVPNLFGDSSDYGIYHRLLDEIQNCGLKEDEIWKLWHGDTHLIADDRARIDYKKRCPTFNYVVDVLRNYFNMDVKATRLNWYRNSDEWKPFHHDASAVDPKKAEIQNFTVGVSFGATRSVEFEDAKNHPETRQRINFELKNGTTYAFTRDINTNWRHGIPQTREVSPLGRISIICWGSVDQKEA